MDNNIIEQKLELVDSLKTYIPIIIENIRSIVEKYRDTNIIEHEEIIFIMEEVNIIIQGVNLTKDVYKDTCNMEPIISVYKEMLDAMANNDTILMIDLMEYEVKENLKVFKAIVDAEKE